MNALEMKEMQKGFSGVPVLKGVSIELKKGQILALLGENGAGKSTLMNILGGIHQADEGRIILFEKEEKILSPRQAKELGVGFVHQELNLVPDLAIYENLFLGEELTTKFGFLDVKEMKTKTREVLKRLGIELDPSTTVASLDPSTKQIIEIAKTLIQHAKIIIMDEPTASLTGKEIESLFAVMSKLKEDGVSIIFISHKLKEVMTICDTYTVMRDGNVISSGSVGDVNEEMIARWMVGKELFISKKGKKEAISAEIVLEAKNLTCEPFYRDVSFRLKKGEVLGFTGLLGDGHSEVFETVFGSRKPDAGEIFVGGEKKNIPHPQKALREGLGYLPRNRKENGIINDTSVVENMTISSLKKFIKGGFIDSKLESESFLKNKKALSIKVGNEHLGITSLSGGNQQKVILSKWIEANSDIIILDNPTQGVDVGAKEEIYELIESLAEKGKSFVVLSSEINEILRVSDRILVMYQGEIVGELDQDRATEETIMLYATGARRDSKEYE